MVPDHNIVSPTIEPRSASISVKGKGVNRTQTQYRITMKPIDQRERTRGRNDILTRRLKNRERQRRYRARKRLESESKNSSIIKPSTSPDVEVKFNGTVSHYMPRVHCERNWKKEARRAHVSRDPEVASNVYAVPTLMPTSENPTVFLPGTTGEPKFESETYAEASVDQNNSEMNRPILGRRDWKADARKKRN